LEDIVTQWLRENDPYYTSRDRNKRKKEEYVYLTERRQQKVREKEIPISQFNPPYSEGGDSIGDMLDQADLFFY